MEDTSNAHSLFSRLLLLLLAELRNLHLDILIEALLQLRAIAEEEQDLHPDEERCQQQGLDQIVKQRRGTSLEFAMSDKLGQP